MAGNHRESHLRQKTEVQRQSVGDTQGQLPCQSHNCDQTWQEAAEEAGAG